MNDSKLNGVCGAIFLSVVLTIGLVIWVTTSYFEAKVFNRVAQPQIPVTTFDAMFTELRIIHVNQ